MLPYDLQEVCMAAKELHGKPLTERGRFWAKHLRQCLQSGLSQVEYCRQNDLSSLALGWWKRQLPRELWSDTQLALPESTRGAFVEIQIGRGQDVTYEIGLRQGRSLRLGPRFDLGQVRQLVQVLEQSC
jgi:hypothetical protein